jgi:sugar diacid utilization regulator
MSQPPDDSAPGDGPDVAEFTRGLLRGAALIVRAEQPEQAVVARFLIDRIIAAANAALQRDDAARPRGSQRAEATATLLAGSGGNVNDRRSTALSLGLDPDAVFFVAVSDIEDASTLTRALTPLGTAHHAGVSNGRLVALISEAKGAPSENVSGRLRDVTARWEREPETARRRLALSGPALGVANLSRAANEAEFVAAMQSTGDVPRRAASFASVDDLGAMGLLYHLRNSVELPGFVTETLGALPARDQRGMLRDTLRAFLESGGSQVDASQRLGIHRNTLAYRMRRIGELIGRDVADPTNWLTLHLALRASTMLEVMSDLR